MIIEQDHPVMGKVRSPTSRSSSTMRTRRRGGLAPLLGQHNREIAGELGLLAAEIDAMVRDGVLYAEEAVAEGRG